MPLLRGRILALGLLGLLAGSAWGAPRITEFLAANDSGLKDEDGEFSDWIEIHNPDPASVSLAGYFLTDDWTNLRNWRFPEVSIEPGGYLVVFASGKNRMNPAIGLHTDFALAAAGESLQLVAPDGVTVVSGIGPLYPPQFSDVSFGLGPGSGTGAGTPPWRFLSAPTPGAANGTGVPAGPIIQPLEPVPSQHAAGPRTIAARVLSLGNPVASVRLFYRRMFTAETALTMVDDGTGADVVPGDGVWTAVIPAAAFVPGEMTRWRFVATDSLGAATQEPAHRERLDSDQYTGTVTLDDRILTALPVFHWFTTNVARAGTEGGVRGSVFYDGELYDNVHFSIHGQSSSGFPKKSYNIDFNRDHRFRWSRDSPRVADIDLLTNWADKSKVRHVLAYEIMRRAGVAAHFAFTVRVQQNGQFFSTADLVEDADETYLERAGLNPDGALYKVYANLLNKDSGNTGNTGVEKKTRKTEANGDLQALINGLDLTGSALERYLYDNIDLPRCVNMLAANSVIRNIDMHQKNWYIYRDTGWSGEWAILPWDLDLSHGRFWNSQDTYFDNRLYTDGYVQTGNSIRLVSHLFANPRINAMILRRIRTLTDRFLQPPPEPGTPENDLFYERRLNELSALIDPPEIVPSDARRDFEKWGSWLQRGTQVPYTHSNVAVESMAEAIGRWKNEYLPGRRRFIYNTQIVGRGGQIPLPQTGGGPTTNYTPLVVKGANVRVLVPGNGTLGTTWTGDPSNEPFVATGWRAGTTGVGYERATGYDALIGTDVDTAMRSNTSVYLRTEFDVPDPSKFAVLELRMQFDDGFVAYLNGVPVASVNAPAAPAWNSNAPASREANPTAFTVFDLSDRKTVLRVGRNVLAIHGLNESLSSSDMIIVPELHAGSVVLPDTLEPRLAFGAVDVSPASGNQDEEYVQITNPHAIAVDVSDWRVKGAIEHTLAPGTVLPPRGTLHLSPNSAAFRARAVSPKGGEGLWVQGGYRNHLSSRGGTLTLLDASGTTNAVASFEGQPTDLQRYLVVSEILYNPSNDELAEFVELLNISTNVTLNLDGVRFIEGVQFDFSGGAVMALQPGGRVIVVRDLAAALRAFGPLPQVAGEFSDGSALNNAGERVVLVIQPRTSSRSSPTTTNVRGRRPRIRVTALFSSRPRPTRIRPWLRTGARAFGVAEVRADSRIRDFRLSPSVIPTGIANPI
ncbi:MAG: CotH kinase family protein [Limisphaerales bacterium]